MQAEKKIIQCMGLAGVPRAPNAGGVGRLFRKAPQQAIDLMAALTSDQAMSSGSIFANPRLFFAKSALRTVYLTN